MSAWLLVVGCGKGSAPPVEGRTAVIDVASWHQSYVASHGRKLPPDETTFAAYVEAQLKERGQPFDSAKFLTSPRDGQKYIVKYGTGPANLAADTVVVHEKEGYDGKVWVGYQMGNTAEVDASQIPALTAAKP